MAVHVDQTGREIHAGSIDFTLPFVRNAADARYALAGDADVRVKPRIAGTIEDAGMAYD